MRERQPGPCQYRRGNKAAAHRAGIVERAMETESVALISAGVASATSASRGALRSPLPTRSRLRNIRTDAHEPGKSKQRPGNV